MSLLLTSPRTGLGLLQVGNFCVSELLRDPPQPVQPCQIYQAGLLGGQTSRGDHCFISHPPLFLLYQTVSVCNPNVCVCVFILGDGSSWNPMAMPGPRLNMRKLFHRTTIDLSGKTASRSFPRWWYLPTSVAMAESFMCNTRLLTRQSHKVEKWELLAVEVKYRWISAAKSSFNDPGFYKSTLLLNCEYFYIFTVIHSILREQWIRAKYERKEFTGDTKYPPLPYTTGDLFNDLLMNSLGLTFLSVSG